jgi:hypothetical protein
MTDQRTYGFNKADAESLLQSIGTSERTYPEVKPRGYRPPKAVILDAALAVATHALTGATSALATVCEWSVADEEYTETSNQETVWNHSESDSYEADTFGFAHLINGHWVFMGDCGPMASR